MIGGRGGDHNDDHDSWWQFDNFDRIACTGDDDDGNFGGGDGDIHEKKDFCGGDGYLGKKNWRKIWPKNGLKWPKIA